MAALLVAGFVGLFSETALNVALGQLSEIFNVGPTTIQWLATGYFLTLGILIPVTGILMQKFTTRQMFLTSIILSLVGTILAASAPAFGVLLTGRVIQAAGLAISLPLTQNVIFTIFPPNKRGGAMGLMGLVMLAGPALGPTLAGLILDTLSWNWIFWLTVPFLLFSLIFGIKFLPNVNEVRNVSIDAVSVILSTIGFGGVVYGFSVSGEFGWSSPLVLGSIIIGLVALIIFAIRQTKMETPMMNLKAFKTPLFTLGVIMSFITFFNMLSMLVILPMYMQMALLMAAFTTGLVLLPGSLLNCVLAPTIGKLFDRYGPKASYYTRNDFSSDWLCIIFTIWNRNGCMADCINSYYYDVRNWSGACFCTNKHAKLSSKTILSRWNCDHSNDPTSSWCCWDCRIGIYFLSKTR